MPKHTTTPSRPKTLYRVKNWSEYEKALVQRGSITFWITTDFEKSWMMKEVFHMTNRSVEGFMRSVFRMMMTNLPVPDHTTISKRSKDLKVNLPKKTNQKMNIVMDSTGLKIYGEGEWKVRQYGGLDK